jgi:hypothetical protein
MDMRTKARFANRADWRPHPDRSGFGGMSGVPDQARAFAAGRNERLARAPILNKDQVNPTILSGGAVRFDVFAVCF